MGAAPGQDLATARLAWQQAQTRPEPRPQAKALFALGKAFKEQVVVDSACHYLQGCLELSESQGFERLALDALHELGRLFYQQTDNEQAQAYYALGLERSQAYGDTFHLGLAHHELGNTSFNAGDIQAAQFHYQAAQGFLAAAGDRSLQAHNLGCIGSAYWAVGNYPQALVFIKRGMAMAEAEADLFSQIFMAHQLADIYATQGETALARKELLHSLEMAKALPHTFGIIRSRTLLGQHFLDENDWPQARTYFQQAQQAALQTTHLDLRAEAMEGLGRTYVAMDSLEQGRGYFSRSLTLWQALAHEQMVAGLQLQLGALALEQGRPEEALPRLTLALELGEQQGVTGHIERASSLLAEAFKQLRQYQKALQFHEQAVMLRDSLHNDENRRAALRFSFQNKTLADSLAYVQQTTENRLAYQEKANRLYFLLAAGLALAFGLILLLRYRFQLRQKQRELELARERERKQQLAELNTVKSRFFANISHELRTPLTLILGPLSYLLDDPEAWDQADIQAQLLRMQRNGQNLLTLIEEILDLSKLEANKMALQPRETELHRFLADTFGVFAPQFEAQEVTARFDPQFPQGLKVMIDPPKLEKVLNNLLSNALKFTPSGGTVELIAREKGPKLHLEVADTGPGIHPLDLPQVFDRFYQAQHSPGIQPKGTGIGLGLARELVELMGGKLAVESKLSEGSRFWLEIPRILAGAAVPVTEAAGKVPAAISLLPPETRYRVLLVEDHWDMRDFIRELLERQGMSVWVAGDGEAAIKLLQEKAGEIDLVISDVMMPRRDGLSLLTEIKNHPTWKELPIMLLTALASERAQLKALTLGVNDYLIKPFAAPELLARVAHLLLHDQARQAYRQSPEYQEEALAWPEAAHDEAWVQELRAQIEASLPEKKWDVPELAEAAHLSPRQLRRRIKGSTGLSPAKFIREVQLQLAREALEAGQFESLADLAYRCGFEHQGTFSTSFKARFGQSPSAYSQARTWDP